MNDFERKLKAEQPRQIPPAWREEILGQARAAAGAPQASPAIETRLSSSRQTGYSFRSWVHSLLWPHPRAWATLAAVWIAIGCLRWASEEPATPRVAGHRRQPTSRSPVELLCLAEQQRLQRELLGSSPARPTEPVDRRSTPPVPKPHSAAMPSYRVA